jgi:hypothetical protein
MTYTFETVLSPDKQRTRRLEIRCEAGQAHVRFAVSIRQRHGAQRAIFYSRIANIYSQRASEAPRRGRTHKTPGVQGETTLLCPNCRRTLSECLGSPRLRPTGAPGSAREWAESSEIPNKSALEEFLIHGLKYAFPPERGELTRGVPTGYAAEPLKGRIAAGSEPPPVWPSPHGKTRGYSFAPLYKTVPQAALQDPYLYEVLALVDAMRDGRSRERQIAEEELKARLHSPRYAELQR